MASNPISALSGALNSTLASGTSFASTVMAAAQAISSGGNIANSTDLWPVQSWGAPQRVPLAGVQIIEQAYHYPFEQGRFTERAIGDAMAEIETKKVDLDEKIQHYLSLNTLALHCQLSDTPRAIKMVSDSIRFVHQVRAYVVEIQGLISALQANVQLLLATETRMQSMIQANLNALSNLLHEVCNWTLPALPSLAVQLGDTIHWNGFNFNPVAGFHFNSSLGLDFSFAFPQCSLRTPNLASFFTQSSLTAATGSSTFSQAGLPLPLDGTYGVEADFANPNYIARMQATTTAVYAPSKVQAVYTSSLPPASSIVSNYSLHPAVYAANIVATVPALVPAIIQAADPDYGASTISSARTATLRSLLTRFITLDQVVSSGFDPNITSAWIIYLALNRAGRAGTWIPGFEAAYQALIAPSVAYLQNTPIPWNQVLGGTGISDAPQALPLVATLQGAGATNLLWRLSYLESSLLGYARCPTWDDAADSAYLSSFTGGAFDYQPTSPAPTPTATTTLGAGTAAYPVAATYPVSLAGVLATVIAEASSSIAAVNSYQSVRPQFRYTYDMFAQATMVDKYTQFWRDFNANLVTVLGLDPYTLSFLATYPAAMNAAINPLAESSDPAHQIEADCAARSRSWTPGSALPPVPSAITLVSTAAGPTALTNGWQGATFDASAFLARPDIQAQPLPTQAAMLRTNQSYASLLALSTSLSAAVQTAVSNAQLATTTVMVQGWETESLLSEPVPPGLAGLVLALDQTDFDNTGYVTSATTITIQQTSSYILNGVVNWDPTGESCTRGVVLTQNGIAVVSVSVGPDDVSPFQTQFSTLLPCTVGDVIQIQALHNGTRPQTVLQGSNFLGMLDDSAQPSDMTPVTTGNSGGGGNAVTTITLPADAPFPVLTALVISKAGGLAPVDATLVIPGETPFLDGIALTPATAAGEMVTAASVYGQVYTAPSANWMVGGLLYASADGTLTQDYDSLGYSVRWIICVGKALTADSFVYEPHIPTNYTITF